MALAVTLAAYCLTLTAVAGWLAVVYLYVIWPFMQRRANWDTCWECGRPMWPRSRRVHALVGGEGFRDHWRIVHLRCARKNNRVMRENENGT